MNHRRFRHPALLALVIATASVAHAAESTTLLETARAVGESALEHLRARTASVSRDAEAIQKSAAAHQRMPDTLYASSPISVLTSGDASCPAPHTKASSSLLQTFDLAPQNRESSAAGAIAIGNSAQASGLARPSTGGGMSGLDGTLPPHLITAEAAPLDDGGHAVYLFPSAAEPARQGFVRVINHQAATGTVSIVATDDTGRVFDPLTLAIAANQTIHFNSDDLENGNTAKGLTGATGAGQGDWRLEFTTDLDIEVLAYIRSTDGFLTAMTDIAPVTDSDHRIAIFNPGSNQNQVSWLRLVNPGTTAATVTIQGTDDNGDPGSGEVRVTVDAENSKQFSAAQLENGASGLSGALGDGTGKWRLSVSSDQPLVAMSLLESPTDHLTNLSTVAPTPVDDVHAVPLFPSAADSSGRQGFLRVINHSATSGEVLITAYDESTRTYDPITLSIGANRVVHFNSDDLEQGNTDKGLSGGVGAGEGDWRLELTSALDVEVLAYIRSSDGFLTSMHDIAPTVDNVHRIAILNPGSNRQQESLLRLVNPNTSAASVTISGIDGDGAAGTSDITLTLSAGETRTIGAWDLETGANGFSGALGDGAAKWQIIVTADRSIIAMSLLRSPTGHLTNLSTAPDRGVGETSNADTFTPVSAIVQSKCINCHVDGGASGHTRLVFVPDTDPDHFAKNRAMFDALLEEEDANYVLNRIQGVSHGGGIQVPAGTQEFDDMQAFLESLGGDVGETGISASNLFETVALEAPRTTLRRAALMFAGRAPREAEYAAVESGDEAALRTTIRRLLVGDGFHDFLIRSANDRLLTDAEEWVIDPGAGFFYAFNQENYERYLETQDADDEDRARNQFWRWRMATDFGFIRAPLELIAHVVENDRPYTEILTADYIMANPYAADAYGATTRFDNRTDFQEFRPSEIESYYRFCAGVEWEYVTDVGLVIKNPGPCSTDYPHAGVLNTTAFLTRYPTTATNRNRARSRWTYYHFLGVDIEQSAPRTTDPVALADTNNPTLSNPNCTVCHTVMDPVAGTFQNYDENGYYKSRYGGMDSLDQFYKTRPDGTEHQVTVDASENVPHVITADGWIAAGAREIGLRTVNDRDDGHSNLHLDYLTLTNEFGDVVAHVELEEISQRNWDGVSAEVCCDTLIVAVDVPSDGVYSIEVAAWVGYQNDDAEGRDGTLLVSIGGPFYRDGDTWYRDMRDPGFNGFNAPDGETSTAWMAQQTIADDRFADATVRFWWPTIMGEEVATPPADGDADFEGRLVASNAQSEAVAALARAFRQGVNGGSAYNLKDLLVEITLSPWFRAASVSDNDPVRAVALEQAGAKRLLTPEELARKTAALTGFHWNSIFLGRPVDAKDWTNTEYGYGLLYGGIDSDGITERARDLTPIMMGVAKRHAVQTSCPTVMKEFYLLDDQDRRLFDGIDPTRTPATPSGRTAIRAKLVDLHESLLGMTLASDAPEIDLAYDLFVEIWERQNASNQGPDFRQVSRCDFWTDRAFFDGVDDDLWQEELDRYGNPVGWDWDGIQDFIDETEMPDANYAARTWSVVLAYLLTDYRYLHL